MNHLTNAQNFRELYWDLKKVFQILNLSLLKFYDHNYHKIIMPLTSSLTSCS